MVHFSKKKINNLDKIYRLNLINSCTGYKSANLLGSIDSEGNTNLAVFSSITHLGSNPAMIGFVLRPRTVPRNTYNNMFKLKYFTVNHINVDDIKDAHHTSAKYDKEVSEFEITNLEEEYKNGWHAPFVKSSPIQIGLTYCEEYLIKSNNCIQLIGEIKDLFVRENLLEDDGFVNLSKGDIVAINGLDGYTLPKLKARLEYQRPKKNLNSKI